MLKYKTTNTVTRIQSERSKSNELPAISVTQKAQYCKISHVLKKKSVNFGTHFIRARNFFTQTLFTTSYIFVSLAFNSNTPCNHVPQGRVYSPGRDPGQYPLNWRESVCLQPPEAGQVWYRQADKLPAPVRSGINDQLTWLGAESVSGSTFRWEDGSPWDYTNWAPGRWQSYIPVKGTKKSLFKNWFTKEPIQVYRNNKYN